MIGHESRRPAAKPRLGIGASASVGVESVSLAGFHTGRDRAARQDALVPHVGARMSRYGT